MAEMDPGLRACEKMPNVVIPGRGQRPRPGMTFLGKNNFFTRSREGDGRASRLQASVAYHQVTRNLL